MARALFFIIIIAASFPSFAQELEEIMVTALRVDQAESPAKFLRRHGDFLLLRVRLTNDSREEEARESEMYATLRRIISDAERADEIEVSLVTSDDLVVPLTENNYRVRLNRDSRPDTSAANISVKTAITGSAADGQALVNQLRDFVDNVDVEGRTELVPEGAVEISIVGPHQYRDDIVKIFSEDVQNVTGSLGDNYRVIVEGIDRPVR